MRECGFMFAMKGAATARAPGLSQVGQGAGAAAWLIGFQDRNGPQSLQS